jgi:LPXTG-motif cell wall-anchored protein
MSINKKDANKGRYGDTEIRNFTNPDTGKKEDQHVNAYEAYLLDNYEGADKLVSNMGSGTINPKTGKKENFDPFTIGLGIAAITGGIGAYRSKKKTGSAGGPGSWWDYSFGKHGVGKYIGDKWLGGDEEKALKEQAGEIVQTGLQDLEAEGSQYLGPEGFLRDAFGRKTEGLQTDYEQNMSNIGTTLAGTGARTAEYETGIDIRKERGGFASGPDSKMERITQQMNNLTAANQYGTMTTTSDKYLASLDEAGASFEKGKLDYISGLKKQKVDLLSDYMTATGEAYSGNKTIDAFDTWLSTYDTFDYDQG